MHVVLIGCDQTILTALCEDDQIQQITAFVADSHVDAIRDTGDRDYDFHPAEAWPTALNLAEVALFVISNRPAQLDALKLLAQSGHRMLASHPACSMIDGFELQMVQRDTGAAIQPLCPGLNHPLLDVLEKWARHPEQSPIGAIEQITVQRPVPNCMRRDVTDSLARDALCLRRVLAKVNQVSAIGVDTLDQEDWSQLSVQVRGESGIVARWTCVPESARRMARWEIIGASGAAEVLMPDDPNAWELLQTDPYRQPIELPCWPGYRELLSRFQSEPQPHVLTQRDWDHACRSGEIVDAAEQSCRRGKTISIYHEQHTEEATFKSIMAAGGCLLLLGLLGFMMLLQAIQTIRPEVADWAGWAIFWRVLLVGFFGFLALQLLRLVFRST